VFQRGGPALDLEHRLVQRGQGLLQHRTDGGARCEDRILRQVGQVRRPVHGSAVRLLFTGQHPEQGRLAGSVLADQADPLAGRGPQIDAWQDGSGTVRHQDVDGHQ
jgi:hypothetical protein